MARAPPPRALPAAACATALVLGSLLLGPGAGFEHQIVNFNFETVEVTWDPNQPSGTNLTFLYRFEPKNDSECSSYILRHGRRAGCLLAAEGDAILYFSVWNGTQRLLSRSPWISSYLKPSAPRALRVLWRPEAVTVACPDLPFRGLQYEVQHKSSFDPKWQSQVRETCNVTLQGLDADKCYSFRARVTTIESYYGSTTYPSDWSEVTHLQKGQPRDSCLEDRAFFKFLPIYVLATLLSLLLLILCVWKLRRAKRVLMPSVPDPKASFPGLFECHRGNFQAWITDTENLTHLPKAEEEEEEEDEDEEGDPEGVLVEGLETETVAGSPCPPTTTPAPEGAPGRLPGPPLQGEEAVALAGGGGFRFTVDDNCYVML